MVKIEIIVKDNNKNCTGVEVNGSERNASFNELYVSSIIRSKLVSLKDIEGFDNFIEGS